MATKKAGRPATSTRDDQSVKVDRELVTRAKFVAERRRIHLAEYLTELLQPLVARDFDREVQSSKKGNG
jgi:hypothetical protein